MSTQVQIRRGNTAQTAAFTGSIAELTVDTDKKVVVVHDGTTAGGNPLIKANASITTGQILTSNGSHLLALSNTGTAGTYGNASYIPVVTTDAYGRVSSVTNTAIAISSGVVTGVMTFAQGGANATSYTTGGLLTSNGTAFVSVANTGTAGTYGNAAYHPVITTDTYGRVSAVTNTLVQIAASQVTSGVLPFAQGGSNNTTYTTGAILTSNGTAFVALANTGTAGTYANAAYIPVITTDAYGRVSSVTNTAVAIDTSQITSGTVADARLPTKGTAGTYANAAYIPVITTDSYGRVTGVTNTAVAIDTSQLTSGTVADARLPTKGTAGTYANSTYIPVITTDAYGRVTAITNTVIQSSTTSVQGIVQLTDSISSTSTTTAATPNSVKTAYDLAATKFSSSGGTVSGDTTITGNLIVNGTTTTVNTSTVSTSDSLLKLANNNTAGDSLDIGFYGTYNATGQKYAGLVRQAGSNFFLFKDLTTDPTSNALATGSLTASNTATLRANITGGTVSSLASAIGVADGGTGATTLTAGGILIGSGTSAVTILANTGTAGTYGNAAYHPVITTDAYGRVSAVTNTAIAIDTAAITSGTLADARLPTKGTAGTYANAAYVPVLTTDSYGRVTAVTNTAIAIDTSALTSGTVADARLPTKGTAGTYANAAYVPVITTDAYGRVSSVTNTAISIDTSQLGSGTIADARLPTKGTAGVYGNAAYHPVITTDAYGRVTAVTNTLVQIATTQITSGVLPFAQGGANAITYTTGTFLTSNGTAFVSVANTGTAGTYANASYVPVITTDAYGRVSAVTNTAIAIDTGAITSGTIADARLPTKGTAGTYANAAYVPVITTDSYGRITGVTNTAIAIDTAAITSGTLADARLPTKGTAGTYANSTYVPVITTDAYGRVTAITNTAISFPSDTDTLQTVTTRGSTTANAINVTNTTSSTSKTTGALVVAGGVGVAGDLFAGNSIVVDNGAYGNVTISQFASVYGQAYGSNPYSIMQVRSNDFKTGMGMQTYAGLNGLFYSNTGIQFNTSSIVRDKDYPTGGTNAGQFAANGAFIAQASLASTSNATGSIQVVGGIGVKGNVSANGIIFDDGTRQTSAGASLGDALALSIALG